jgi:hypothetical protein
MGNEYNPATQLSSTKEKVLPVFTMGKDLEGDHSGDRSHTQGDSSLMRHPHSQNRGCSVSLGVGIPFTLIYSLGTNKVYYWVTLTQFLKINTP